MRRGALLLLLLLLRLNAGAAESIYFERGKIDFDTAMERLNPYGTWTGMGGRWSYTPLDHAAPYQHGRWLYTDYGWYWQGAAPHSWMTEHYGFWKRGASGLWSWYPAPDWLPQIVEMRATPKAIGWRCAEVDSGGSFLEEPDARYAKPEEWSFVSLANFVRPILPPDILSQKIAATLLDDSTSSMHTYVTYRAIERPGPHPADFVHLAGDGGMFPPQWVGEALSPVARKAPGSSAPGPKGSTSQSTAPAPVFGDANVSPSDARQVHSWTILSLPTFWSPSPADAKPDEIYLFRPEIYQDQEGIERRIRLWLNPKAKALEKGNLNDALKETPPRAGTATRNAPTSAGANPFRSPFDESFHGDESAGTAQASATNAAPDGRSEPAAPTNAAPAVP